MSWTPYEYCFIWYDLSDKLQNLFVFFLVVLPFLDVVSHKLWIVIVQNQIFSVVCVHQWGYCVQLNHDELYHVLPNVSCLELFERQSYAIPYDPVYIPMILLGDLVERYNLELERMIIIEIHANNTHTRMSNENWIRKLIIMNETL